MGVNGWRTCEWFSLWTGSRTAFSSRRKSNSSLCFPSTEMIFLSSCIAWESSHDPSIRKSCKNIQSVVVIDVLFSWNWVRLLIRLTLPRREEEKCRLSRWDDNVKWTERNNRLPCHGYAWLIPHQMVFFLKFIHKALILFVLRRRKTTADLLFDVTAEFLSLGMTSMLNRLTDTPWEWGNSIISRLLSFFMSERIKSLEDIFSFLRRIHVI